MILRVQMTRLGVLVVVILGLVAVAWADEGDGGDEDDGAPPVMDGLTGGDTPWERAFDEAMLQGREAYNSENRERARDAFVEAIQILPQRPAPYRNLARNYNLMGEYPEATEYYDHYLRLAPEAEDREMIRQERRGTASRSDDEPWTPPASQRMARRAFERELDSGLALSEQDGGAWGLYQTLLDTGYASPQLARWQRDLEQMLRRELEAKFEPHDGFLPLLDEQGWALQQERLNALQSLTRSEQGLEFVARRQTLVVAAQAILEGAGDDNVERAKEAVEANEDVPLVRWFELLALEQAQQPQKALEVLDELLDAELFSEAGAMRARVVRAQLLQQLDGVDEAVEEYQQILGP